MRRFLWLGFVLSVYLICTGCGDTFRPIIIPNPPTFPNPAGAHTVVSINDNAPPLDQAEAVPGSAMVIDVSGDSTVSVAKVGLAPVNAVQQSASVILVANHSVTGAVADSITKLSFSGTTISSSTTISLPPNSAPNFVATTESSQAYVLLPSYVPNPINNPGVVVPSLGVINTNGNSLIATLPVGNSPIAMAETPNAKQLYVANQVDSTIDGFDINGQNLSPRVGSPVSTSLPPIWFSARSDSQMVYVLEGDGGTLGALNVTATAGPDTLIEYPALAVAGANIMTYDPNLNRLYIPGGQQVAIVDVSQSAPQFLAGGPIPTCAAEPESSNCIPTVAPSLRSATDPCSLTTAQPLTVVAVAALPDGSQAYVGVYYEDSNNNICPQVTAIDAVSNTVTNSTAVPGFPDATISGSQYYVQVCAKTRFRFMMGAAGDSSRVYLSSCDGGMVNIVDTSNDTYILNQPAPAGLRAPISPSLQNPPQNPVFLIAGP
jgi:DNA-binding beta-propeller fold protein YncE